jgi:long-subunit fatty acid transport protein
VNTGPIQPIPRIMLSVNGDTFGVDGVALGAYVYAPNNGHYTFGADTPTRFSLIDRNLLEVYYGLAFGYRFGDVIAVGAGLQFVTAGLDQQVALSADQNSGESPTGDIVIHVTGRQDFIPSGNFGVWSNPGKLLGIGDLEVGGSVQLGRTVKATGPVSIVSKGSAIEEDIKNGLVTLDVNGATATAEFRLAPFYRVGAKYGGGDGAFKYDVEADFVYEQWSVYDHIFLATKGAKVSLGAGSAPKELAPVVQPKDWNDSYSVRLGGTGAFLDGAAGVHAGAYYESSAIPNTTYDIELADGDKIGAGLGVFGKLFGTTLTVGYSHVFIFDRTVGTESIVYDGSSGPSILLGGADIRTRVAMGKYSAGFDMLDIAVTVGIDELFGFGDAHKPASQAK